MGKQERIIDGVSYIGVVEAGRMLAPLHPREARRLMKEQGVWPEAVRSPSGLSPDTFLGEDRQLLVELKEAENLARIFSRN